MHGVRARVGKILAFERYIICERPLIHIVYNSLIMSYSYQLNVNK